MRFTHECEMYKVNDDLTITVKVGENYYRCKTRLDVLMQLKDIKQGEKLVCEFGIGYYKGSTVLQIICLK